MSVLAFKLQNDLNQNRDYPDNVINYAYSRTDCSPREWIQIDCYYLFAHSYECFSPVSIFQRNKYGVSNCDTSWIHTLTFPIQVGNLRTPILAYSQNICCS